MVQDVTGMTGSYIYFLYIILILVFYINYIANNYKLMFSVIKNMIIPLYLIFYLFLNTFFNIHKLHTIYMYI